MKKRLISSPKRVLINISLLLVFGVTILKAQSHKTLNAYNNQTEIKASGSVSLTDGFFVPFGKNVRIFTEPELCIPFSGIASTGQNYISTKVFKKPGMTVANLNDTISVCEVNQSIQYFDDLGRPLQIVTTQGSPTFRDIVQPIAYDLSGRESTKYLPYTSASGNAGSYKADALLGSNGYSNSAQKTFYAQGSQGYKDISSPYSVTVFEPSPLNRVIEQGAPGDVWQPATSRSNTAGRTSVFAYGTNNTSTDYTALGSAVRYYSAELVNTEGDEYKRVLSGTGYYLAGQLYITIVKRENWIPSDGKAGTIEEYKDKLGRVILKRAFNRKSDLSIETLSTYYVYDALNNLSFVLPPAAEPDAPIVPDQAKLEAYCYQYRYDGRKRVIEKKIPGKDLWEFIVYNQANQPALTQDGVQRENGKWMFTKYDGLGRVIMTGQITDIKTRSAMQSMLDEAYPWMIWEFRESGSVTGYTNYALPNQNIEFYHTINYYDDYSFMNMQSVLPAQSQGIAYKAKGMLTGRRVYLIDGSASYWTLNYYDKEGRLQETVAQNHLGGTDRVVNEYHFSNELKSSVRTHTVNGINTVIANNYKYDHMGREISTGMNINNTGEIILNRNHYNELGQLLKKELHSTDGTNFLQNTSYSYNDRGWLKGGRSSEFSYQLNYNDAVGTASAQYNGNISNQLWGLGLSMPNVFSYKYDKLDRLIDGTSSGIYMSEAITYDLMGNIKSLSRDGGLANTYHYVGNSNRLSSVDNITSTVYEYDVNGNAKKDARNGMTLNYNYLNLPESAGNGIVNVNYIYDATGVKLRKQSSTQGTTNYVNGIQYKPDGTIDFIQTEQGIARRSGMTFNYEYNLTDHLGNVRYTFYKNPVSQALERLQSDDYYAFGKRKSSGPVVSVNNKYLYNGKEVQDELGSLNEDGQYDYGARFYDPVIGRWNVIDPKAELGRRWSPYAYAFDNPIYFIDPDGMWPGPGPGFWGGVKQGFTGYFGNIKQAVLHPVQTIQSQFTPGAIKENLLNTATFGTYGVAKQGLSVSSAALKGDLSVLGHAVGTKLAEATVVLATEGLAKGIKGLKSTSSSESNITLYRGVNESHPGFSNALEGRAVPRGGRATAAEHNAGDTASDLTSWTTNRDVARNYALRPDGSGVVLEVTVPASSTVASPSLLNIQLRGTNTVVNESEVLLRGRITDAKVTLERL